MVYTGWLGDESACQVAGAIRKQRVGDDGSSETVWRGVELARR